MGVSLIFKIAAVGVLVTIYDLFETIQKLFQL